MTDVHHGWFLRRTKVDAEPLAATVLFVVPTGKFWFKATSISTTPLGLVATAAGEKRKVNVDLRGAE